MILNHIVLYYFIAHRILYLTGLFIHIDHLLIISMTEVHNKILHCDLSNFEKSVIFWILIFYHVISHHVTSCQRAIVWFRFTLAAASTIHEKSLWAVMHTPLQFFVANPSGQLKI